MKTAPLTDLQALVAGAIYGALMRQEQLLIEAEILHDDQGNYKPEVRVEGLVSGERLIVRIEVEDEPEPEPEPGT
jgi:hypothetical protein